ncbi:DUF4303 domain-containing protein [Streptomyces sp. NPDC056178]|uniref:DUF4303 domain-containing protein n=1 Tax=unclassified Streptomyces TaxID=2593676 RepID=UPI0035D9EEDE
MDFNILQREVRQAARDAFVELTEQYPDQVCGYALYSDADAITICCAANTRDHLTRMQAHDPADADLYVWSPPEWAFEGIAAQRFDEFCTQLREYEWACRNRDDFDPDVLRNQVYETCVAALDSLAHGGFFGGPDRESVVVFIVSDDEEPKRDRRWIQRLNPPHLARQYDGLSSRH